MEKLDVTIAVAGVAILAVALAGSALTGVRGGTEYALSFPLKEESLPGKSADVQGAGSAEFTFTVAGFNVSVVTFSATPASSVPHPNADEIRIAVTTPDGALHEADGNTITIHVADPPASEVVRATSPEGAAGAGPAASDSGVGDWRVEVSLTHPDPVPAPHTVTVGGSLARWSAEAAPDLPAPR